MEHSHEMIICIVNNGFSDAVMDAARAAGARGGTVMSARGTAGKEAEKLFNISIQPEKELVMILVGHEIRDGVLHDFSECDPTGTEIHILQADCVADAEWVRDEIRKAYPQVGEITITALGVVIGAHCGPGLLTVFYLCNGRRPK